MSTTAQESAGGRAEATPATRQFVTFEVAGERYAVDMAPVQEIIRVPAVARLPLTPPALQGLANLRGRVLPVVCLRRLLGLPDRSHDDATRALVVDLGSPMGFVVDRVASVVDVDPAEIEPADAVQGVLRSEALLGVFHRGEGSERRLVMVIDFARLVAARLASLAERRAAASPGADAAGNAAQATAQAASQDELRVVSFAVDGQEYAIDIAAVREIVQMPEHVTALPDAPAHLIGLISLRERLLPLVSLRSLFGMAARPAQAEAQRIVVVALPGGAQVGLVTDSVKEVLGVPRALAEAVPEVLSRSGELQELEAICRLDDGRRLVSIIAADRLLNAGAVQQAVEAAREHEERQDMTHDDTHRTDTRAGDDMQLVVFRLGAEEFGVPIMSVQEIVRVPQTLTRVPRTPEFVEGVINLRGSVLPVIDQRRRFGLPAVERNERQRIMVYTLGATRTGFIVDAVTEVLRIARHDVEAAPELGEAGELVAQVAKLDGGARLVMLIEPQRLLAAAELRRLAAPDEGGERAAEAAPAGLTEAAPAPLAEAA